MEIDNEYIKSAIYALYDTVGIKLPIYKELCLPLNNDIQGKIAYIAKILGLPIKPIINYSTEFRSASLSAMQDGRAVGSITAQVSIPPALPLYGSQELTNYPIHIKIGGTIDKHPYTFAFILAHELSHVLLHSLRSPYKDSEIHTDLCAMMMGFLSVIDGGRKIIATEPRGDYVTTKTTTYGYLSDENFLCAQQLISSLCDKVTTKK